MKRLVADDDGSDTPIRRRSDEGFSMRLIIFICFSLMLTGSELLAQNVVPPPGFSPAQDDATPGPAPLNSPTYSGHGTYSNPFSNSGASPYPNSVVDDSPVVGTPKIFRAPSAPLLVFPEDGPAMPRVWFKAEALYWWSKSSPVPIPIVTLGSPADSIPGAIGQPGTSVLLGNQNVGLPGQSGGRFTFGFTFDADQVWGAEISYFSLATATVSQGVSANGSPGSALLAFPFFDPNIPGESASPIALPGNFAGAAVLTLQSFLQSTEVNLLHNVMAAHGVRVDLLGGFRYVNLREGLELDTSSPNVFPNPPGFFHTFDQFNTNNNFYGAQVGVKASYDSSRFFMNTAAKLAMGETFENISVNGGTFTNIGGGFSSANGAYLSQPSNIGSQTRSQFGVVPEFDLNLGVRLTPWASFIVGYSFVYLSSVARPGNQLDHTVNPTQSSAITGNFPANLSGQSSPVLSVHNSDFWAQGLNFALELRF